MLNSKVLCLLAGYAADRICEDLEQTQNYHVERAERIATPAQRATLDKARRIGWSVNFVSDDKVIHMYNRANNKQKMTITADGNYTRTTK